MDDISEGDEVDDDDDVPVQPKRRNDGKLKPPGDMSFDTSDLNYISRPLSVPQPPILMASHPISNDRTYGSHKRRPRLDRGAAVPQSRSPPDDYSYHPNPISFSRGQQPRGYSQHRPRESPHHQQSPNLKFAIRTLFPWIEPYPSRTLVHPSPIQLQSAPTLFFSFLGGLDPHLRQRVWVAPFFQAMIAECTVPGVVMEVGADKVIFLLLLWMGTNVQAAGNQTRWNAIRLACPRISNAPNAPNPVPNPPLSSSSTPSGVEPTSQETGEVSGLTSSLAITLLLHLATSTTQARPGSVETAFLVVVTDVTNITEIFGGEGDGRRGPSPLVVSISGGGKRGDGGVGILNSPVSQGGVGKEKG